MFGASGFGPHPAIAVLARAGGLLESEGRRAPPARAPGPRRRAARDSVKVKLARAIALAGVSLLRSRT